MTHAGSKFSAASFPAIKFLSVAACVVVGALTGCGYHTAGKATRLPPNVSVIAVPMFVNQTQTYKIEQLLTRDVVREFVSRTPYHVVNNAGQDADLVLKGTVVSAIAAPLTYDAQ